MDAYLAANEEETPSNVTETQRFHVHSRLRWTRQSGTRELGTRE
jgi:hypothetical protein